MSLPTRKPAQPTYGPNWYTPQNLKLEIINGNRSQVRKEYTRLRDIAQKRLKRLEAAGYSDTQVYKLNIKHYPKLKDIKTDYELMGRLSDLSRFVLSKMSTVSGRKEVEQKTLSTLHEHGYTFVTSDNLRAFGDFMEVYRNQKLDMLYDSGDAAELYGLVEKHKIDPEQLKKDFEFWLENLEDASKLRYSKKSAGDYEKMKSRLQKKVKDNPKKSRTRSRTGSSGKSGKSRKSGKYKRR